MFLRHPLLSIATFAYLGVVGLITLTPQSGREEDSILWWFAEFFDRHPSTEWITYNGLEFTANVIMFLPFGVFFVLLLGRRQWWLAIVLGVALTVSIEFAQQYIPNRVSDPRDILSNSIGATVGTLVALMLTAAKARRLRMSPARAKAI